MVDFEITRDQLKSRCEPKSFEEGDQLYQNNRVIYARMRGNEIEAALDGLSKYMVTRIMERKGRLEYACGCDYENAGYCKHTVAVLLYVQDNKDKLSDEKNEKYDKIRTVINSVDEDVVKKFLTSELEKNSELRKRFMHATSKRGGKKTHSVAEGMRKKTAGTQNKSKNILKGTNITQKQEFLTVEMEKNKDLRDRFARLVDKRGKKEDYHAMTEKLYKKASNKSNGRTKKDMEINFDPVMDIAYEFADYDDYEDAINVCKGLTEVIAKNTEKAGFDDDYYDDYDDDYYGDYDDKYGLEEYLEFMVECMNRTKIPAVKRQHISYLIERLAHSDTAQLARLYAFMLDFACRRTTDYVFLAMLLKPYIPDVIPAMDKDEKEYRIMNILMEKMLKALGITRDKSLNDFLAKHYRDIDKACLRYIYRLRHSDDKRALRVAEEGVRLFPNNESIMLILHEMYKKTDPKYVESLHRVFVHTKAWNYYDELKRCSKNWGAEFASLVCEFESMDDFDMQAGLFLKEDMHGDAAMLVVQQDSLDMLERYHKQLARLHHKEYHEAYIRQIDELAKSARNKTEYKGVKNHLKNAKSVPHHEKEFGEFIGMLRARHAGQAEFLDELKSF